jgi:hypothetical protein
MAKVGRKTKYNKDVINKICSLIESGATSENAFMQAGISVSTGHRWLDPEDDQNPLTPEQISEFRERMEGAKAKRITVLANRVIRASEPIYLRDEDNSIVTDDEGRPIIYKHGDWRAAAWYLERTEPETYARKEKVEHSGGVTSRIAIPEEVRYAIKQAFRKAITEPRSEDTTGNS